MSFFDDFKSGLQEGFGSMFDELRRITFGYDTKYEDDKATKEALEKATGTTIPPENANGTGGLIGDLKESVIPVVDSNLVVLGFAFVAFLFLIRD